MRINWPATIGFLLFAIAIQLHRSSDYMQFKPVTVTVVEKYLPQGGRYTPSPVMVLRTDEGVLFDLYVGYATYATRDKGDRLVFNLRRFDIRQTGMDNLIYFFGVLFFSVAGFVFAMYAFTTWIFNRRAAHNTNSST